MPTYTGGDSYQLELLGELVHADAQELDENLRRICESQSGGSAEVELGRHTVRY